MKSIFLSVLYPFIRLIAYSLIVVGCGSVQTINGVRLKEKKEDRPNIKNYILITGVSFGFGYYLGKEVLPQKKQ